MMKRLPKGAGGKELTLLRTTRRIMPVAPASGRRAHSAPIRAAQPLSPGLCAACCFLAPT